MIIRITALLFLALATNVIGCSKQTYDHDDLSYVAEAGYLTIYSSSSLTYGFPFRYLEREDRGRDTYRQEMAFRLWEEIIEFRRFMLALNIGIWIGLILLREIASQATRRRRAKRAETEKPKSRKRHIAVFASWVVGIVAAVLIVHFSLRTRHDRQQELVDQWRIQSRNKLSDNDVDWTRVGPAFWHFPTDSFSARWLRGYGTVEALSIQSDRLDYLADFPTLKHVRLTVDQDRPELGPLADLPRLKSLRLSLPWTFRREENTTRVEDITLSAMPSVEMLSCDLEDVAVHGFGGLKSLRILCLTGCNVGDEIIEELAALEDLQFVCLFETKVTPGAVKRLQQFHPDCEIAWQPPKWYDPSSHIHWHADSEPARDAQSHNDRSPQEPLRYTIGQETTHISEPLDRYGEPDYIEFLNQRSSLDVTKENNAAIMLMQVIRPPAISLGYWNRVASKLELDSSQISNHRFIDLVEYCSQRGVDPNSIYLPKVPDESTFLSVGKRENHPFLSEWVAANDEALTVVADAVAKDDFYWPLVVPAADPYCLFHVSVVWAQSLREVNRALLIRASRHLAEGDVDSAIADLTAIHRLAKHLSTHPIIVSSFVSMAISRAAYPGDLAILNSPLATQEQLEQFGRSISQSRIEIDFADRFDHADRMMLLDVATKMFSERVSLYDLSGEPGERSKRLPVENLDADVVLAAINACYDHVLGYWDHESYSARMVAADELESFINDQTWGTTRIPGIASSFLFRDSHSSSFGKLLFGLMCPPVKAYVEGDASIRAEHDMLEVAFAVRAYLCSQGDAPQSWNDLVPNYLVQVPTDRFTDELLHLSVMDGHVRITSTGKDLSLDRGSGVLASAGDGTDLVFSIKIVP